MTHRVVMGWLLVALLALVSIVTCFVPWMIAVYRGHPNALPIFLLCLFLGWTLIGWVVALVWACTDQSGYARYARYRRPYRRW